MVETNASQSWAEDHNWEVQTGYQEIILHLQSSEVLEMVIEGPNLCSLAKSPALEVFETHYRVRASQQSWPDMLWTAGLPAAPSKGHFHLLWHGFCGACKGFCPNCNLLISAFSSFSQDFTIFHEFHCHWILYLFIKLHKKLVNKFKRYLGRLKEKRKSEMQTHFLFFSREEW